MSKFIILFATLFALICSSCCLVGTTIGTTTGGTTGVAVTCSDFKICEDCLTTTACEWCDSTIASSCVDNSSIGGITCNALSGTLVTDLADCHTCTTTVPDPDWCLIDTDFNLVATKETNCETYNTPATTTTIGTIGTVAATTKVCDFSDDCLNAVYAQICTLYCTPCDITKPDSLYAYQACPEFCDNYNTKCADEITSGCLPAPTCGTEPSCAPFIDADTQQGTSSSSSSSPLTISGTAGHLITTSTGFPTTNPTTNPSTNPSSTPSSSSSSSSATSSGTTKSSGASTVVLSVLSVAFMILALL